jgi:D-galactarolactone isomerase
MHALCIPRCVQVTASCYGFDNSVTRYAIEECRTNGIAVRGVAIVHPDIDEAELGSLARAGFVAARLMASRVANVGTDDFHALARRCAAWRWHLEVNVDACDAWLDLEPRLAGSPVPLVFEHLGIGAHDGPDSEGMRALLRLLERRSDFAVKLRLPDVAPVLDVLLRHHPDRLMWGSSLPQDDPTVDDLELIAGMLERLPDPGLRERVFATNAERFYGF